MHDRSRAASADTVSRETPLQSDAKKSYQPRRRLLKSVLWGLIWVCNVMSPAPARAEEEAEKVDFDKQIRPLFQEHCIECHGAETQEAGFRLDLKAPALAGGDSGQSIVPGNSAESRLFQYVAGKNPDILMPPDGKLDDETVELFRRWIEDGAAWPDDPESAAKVTSDHWSFQPIRRPTVPEVPAEWRGAIRNPIDAFVLAELARRDVEPSPEADRETLIRRLSLDLLGLLPSPEEIDAFVHDESPDAYANLVDRLLDSPHFGERWGRHWLDLARYADSDGYEKDRPRPHAWRWRDWVIQSFNDDQPFDRFTVEQLAGDLLPEATLEQQIATGFHRNTLTNTEGGVDQEEYRVKATVDRVNTTGAVWLGLTVGCAQCHSHKYDPLTQREYYQFFDFFNSADEVNIPAPTSADRSRYEQELAAHRRRLDELQQEYDAYRNGPLQEKLNDWVARAAGRDIQWTTLVPERLESSEGVQFEPQDDGSQLVTGENPASATYTIVSPAPAGPLTAVRLEVLADERLPASGPGRVAHGNFVLSRIRFAIQRGGSEEWQDLSVQRADATYHQSAGSPQAFHPRLALVDGDPKRGWAVGNKYGQSHAALFEFSGDVALAADDRLKVVLEQNYGQEHTIGRFRLSATAAPTPVAIAAPPEAVAGLLAKDPAAWEAAERDAVRDYFVTLDAEAQQRQTAVEQHRAAAPKLTDNEAQTLRERGEPRTTQVMIRGDFLSPGAPVEAATPAVLNPLRTEAEGRRTRLDLARWLVDPDHPLTRRVAVNRIWQHLFGYGLVRTTEDFGTRGELPSHPELLDWLACEFLDRGWSRKALIRLIVNSRTYRQSSRARDDLQDVDPLNTLLARQNRFRLSAEVIRDLFLDASGLLEPTVGGPSIRPPLPSGVRELGYANSVRWEETKGRGKYRRGCYIFFQRTVPYPMLTTFDSPDSTVTCTRRERSNTPLQSLTLLNDPVFFECAEALGRELASRPADDAANLARLMQACVGRTPTSQESEILGQLLGDLRGFAAQQPTEGLTSEQQAWAGMARVVLNLDEFITRE